ncbi:Hypothetical protein FKW44_013415, partial [Caligus rogercresseyi]
ETPVGPFGNTQYNVLVVDNLPNPNEVPVLSYVTPALHHIQIRTLSLTNILHLN